MFDSIDGIEASEELKEFLQDKLTQPQGWSTTSIKNDLQDEFGLDDEKAEMVAGTETTSVLGNAREDVYEEIEQRSDEVVKYKWLGPDDHRNTRACEWLREKTNPKYGGEPRSMEKLVELQEEASDKFFPDLEFRRHLPHPRCRHMFTEAR